MIALSARIAIAFGAFLAIAGIVAIGVLFAITILGLALAIAGSRREIADARRG